MSAEQALRPLAGRLRAWGLQDLAALLLEQGDPLAVVGAQLLHIAAPTAGLWGGGETVAALARVLEDPAARQAWARELAGPAPSKEGQA
ncbi:MAG: hypothetical protein JNK29_06825 [Anaerolineales bacterium]|nr:hypothetical protein [Anaerolineales bacterium]